MNNTRRKSIQRIYDKLEELMDAIDTLKEEEQDAYENLPESLQDGDRGEAMSEAIDNLESASDSVSEALEYLTSAQN